MRLRLRVPNGLGQPGQSKVWPGLPKISEAWPGRPIGCIGFVSHAGRRADTLEMSNSRVHRKKV